MDDVRGLLEFLRRARHRYLGNLLISQGLFGLTLALAAAILLLVLGTQILDWYWPVAMFGLGTLGGLVRLARRIPSPYLLAQRLDSRLGLKDSLSTAYHYNCGGPSGRGSAELRAAQLAQAVKICGGLNPSTAVPFEHPRSAYAVAALGVVAFGMLGIRYGVTQSLDLRRPLVSQALLDVFKVPRPELAEARKSPSRKPMDDLLREAGVTVDPQDRRQAEASQSSEAADADAAEKRDEREKAQSREDGAQQGGEEQGSDDAERSSNTDSQSGDDRAPEQAQQDGSQQNSPAKQAAKQPGEQDSMLDKMREAMANLLAKLKIQPKGGDSRQVASSSAGNNQSGRMEQRPGQKGQQGQGRQQNEGSPNAEANGEQEGEGGQRSQAAQGKGGDKSAEQQASNEARSGVGKNDGSKELREAEQLAAMGKISEIFGKRSQQLKGEVMVEVASGKQRLKTPYSGRKAEHGQAGGEVHRDEVPLAYQHYVSQYFEEVRKTPPAQK